MAARLSGGSVPGWRFGPRRGGIRRPARVTIAGDEAMAHAIARRLAAGRIASITVLLDEGRAASEPLSPRRDFRHEAFRADRLGATDALIACTPAEDAAGFSRLQDLARLAARACPEAVFIIAADNGLDLCARLSRACWLDPSLLLSPGGIPLVMHERDRLARRHGLDRSQIQAVAIGADGPRGLRLVQRYTTVCGVPAGALDPAMPSRPAGFWPGACRRALAQAAVALARAVILDRRAAVCCGAWVEGTLGIPGAFVTMPVRVGARGAGEPLSLRLSLDERTFLMSSARFP